MIPKSLWKYRGLMVIALWQTTPVEYGIGFGEGRVDEYFVTGGGCEPDAPPAVEHYRKHRPRSFGASINAYPSPRLRIGGGIALTSADTTSLSGPQAKAVLAGEWKWLGIGTGFVLGEVSSPGLYLRIGQLNSAHLRLDFPDAAFPVSSTGVGRAGLAYNQTAAGFGAFIGIPLCYTTCVYGAGGARGDVRIPVGSAFRLDLSGFMHEANEEKHWGVAVGLNMRR